MNWAKHAAEAIVDDEQALQETEDRRRRNKLLLTLGGLAGAAGLGAGLYAARKPIGEAINSTFSTPEKPFSLGNFLGGLAGRTSAATAALAAPSRFVANRVPGADGVGKLVQQVSNVQAGKATTPAEHALAVLNKTNPALINNLNSGVLNNPKLVNEMLEASRTAHNQANPGAPIAGPLAGLSAGGKLKEILGGVISGTGISQGQRDISQLPAAFEHLGTSGTSAAQDLRGRVGEALGLPSIPKGEGAYKAYGDQLQAMRNIGRALKARSEAPTRFMRAGGLGGNIVRGLAGGFAPEVLSGLGSAFHTIRGE